MNLAPKNKYSRESMVKAALQIVRERGISGLTAKSLAAQLGTSTQPVFTAFGSMDVLKAEVRAEAEKQFDRYLNAGLSEEIPFLGLGMQYIRFGREEPEWYRFLFLTEMPDRTSGLMNTEQKVRERVLGTLMDRYHLSEAEADRYFRDLWLVAHSMATLNVTGGCPYEEPEIRQILSGFSIAVLRAIREIPGFTEGTYDRDAAFRAAIGGNEGSGQ